MNDRCAYVINLEKKLSMDYVDQYNAMEEFARWNLPEEIGLEWIDAEEMGIIGSDELIQSMSYDSIILLKEIVKNFNNAFEDPTMDDVWTHEAMQKHGFWNNQRLLAKRFLNTVS